MRALVIFEYVVAISPMTKPPDDGAAGGSEIRHSV
jgi:hypothetical protein